MPYIYAPPTEQDAATACRASEQLSDLVGGDEKATHFIYDSLHEEFIELPEAAVAVLQDVLKFLTQGQGLTIVPHLPELTTLEAAQLLNVSQPYLLDLLEVGEIPFHKVGSQRRIHLADLLAYQRRSRQRSNAAMDELVALSQELGLYD